jgi:hypothetical protein
VILTFGEEGILKGGEEQGQDRKKERNENFTFDFS